MAVVVCRSQTRQREDHLGAALVVLVGRADTSVDNVHVDGIASFVVEGVGEGESVDVRVGRQGGGRAQSRQTPRCVGPVKQTTHARGAISLPQLEGKKYEWKVHALRTRDADDSIFLNPRDILGGQEHGNTMVVQLRSIPIEDGLVKRLHTGSVGSVGLGNHAIGPVEMRSSVANGVRQFDLKGKGKEFGPAACQMTARLQQTGKLNTATRCCGSREQKGTYNIRTGLDLSSDELEAWHGGVAGTVTRDIAGDGGAKDGVDGRGTEEDCEECGCVHDVDSINWVKENGLVFVSGEREFRAHVKCVGNEKE